MTVSPLPRHGEVLLSRGVSGRALRMSAHSDTGQVVLSVWQAHECRATFVVRVEDVPDVVAALTRTALAATSADGALGQAG